MPYLYGKPFKWELYAKVHKLDHDLAREMNEHRTTRRRLRFAEAKIQEMESRLREIAGIAAEEITEAARQRFQENEQKRHEALMSRALAS